MFRKQHPDKRTNREWVAKMNYIHNLKWPLPDELSPMPKEQRVTVKIGNLSVNVSKETAELLIHNAIH